MARSLAYLVTLVKIAGRYLAALFVMNKPTHRIQFALEACVIIVSVAELGIYTYCKATIYHEINAENYGE